MTKLRQEVAAEQARAEEALERSRTAVSDAQELESAREAVDAQVRLLLRSAEDWEPRRGNGRAAQNRCLIRAFAGDNPCGLIVVVAEGIKLYAMPASPTPRLAERSPAS